MRKDLNIKIYQGNALEVLKGMEAESVDMCMTSPPYWGLRDYGSEPFIWDGDAHCVHEFGKNIIKKLRSGTGASATVGNTVNEVQPKEIDNGNFCIKCNAWKGSLGLEPTFQLYINHLIQIFDEIQRVLKDTGTCWVNIGDTYEGGNGQWGKGGAHKGNESGQLLDTSKRKAGNIKSKSLIGIPERFVIAMTDAGWIRRNSIIWFKPNCMPSSADDRFTVDFEYLYFFTKKPNYWFEQQLENRQTFENRPDAIVRDREYGYDSKAKKMRSPAGWKTGKGSHGSIHNNGREKTITYNPDNLTNRNKRCVWKISTQSYSDAHFATYPEELCYTPIKAGCPKYICKKCGKAREKVMERDSDIPVRELSKVRHTPAGTHKAIGQKHQKWLEQNPLKDKGLTDCGCNAGFKGGTVLDPFMGSGTTLKVARELGRKGIGIDLNPEYIDMAKKRIGLEQSVFGFKH